MAFLRKRDGNEKDVNFYQTKAATSLITSFQHLIISRMS